MASRRGPSKSAVPALTATAPPGGQLPPSLTELTMPAPFNASFHDRSSQPKATLPETCFPSLSSEVSTCSHDSRCRINAIRCSASVKGWRRAAGPRRRPLPVPEATCSQRHHTSREDVRVPRCSRSRQGVRAGNHPRRRRHPHRRRLDGARREKVDHADADVGPGSHRAAHRRPPSRYWLINVNLPGGGAVRGPTLSAPATRHRPRHPCHGWPEDAGGLSAVSHVRSEAAL